MVSAEIAKSRWRYDNSRNRITAILDALGVDYRKVKGQSFWEANAVNLTDIYRDFVEESGQRLLSLHPDRTKQATDVEFAKFANTIALIKKRFIREGISITARPVADNVLQVPHGMFRKPSRALEVMRLIREGMRNKPIALQMKCRPAYVAKARRILDGDKCGCGRPASHVGWCIARLAQYKGLPFRVRGFTGHKHSVEARAVMSRAAQDAWDAKTDRRKSEETRRRMREGQTRRRAAGR